MFSFLRLAALAVVCVLSLLSIGGAFAQSTSCPIDGGCDQGTAYARCMSDTPWNLSQNNLSAVTWRECNQEGTTPASYTLIYRGSRKSDGVITGNWNGGKFYYPGGKCSSRPSQTTTFLPVTGSTRCNRGCVMTYAQNADETSVSSPTGSICSENDFSKKCPSGSYWNGYMGVCEPIDKPCPEGQKKKNGQCVPDGKCPDGMIATQGTTPGAIQQGSLYCSPEKSECPAGNVKSPSGQCLPGDGQCAAGEAKGKDGTCKKDANGDGKPDEEEGNQDPNKDSASGGDSCDAPPSCSGNAIQCMQVKVQWRIDCNTRKNRNITGGTCEAVPICTGYKCDAMEYASLLQQWKSACALEKLAGKAPGQSGGDGTDANGNGVPDALEGAIGSAGAGETPNVTKFGAGFSTSVIDRENIFGSGSCPQPPSFQLMGQTISGADFPYWCQAMAILRSLILIFGAFTALKILMGGIG